MQWNKIYNDDTLKILKSLPDNCIDMIWGDPDYNVGINYNGKKYTQKWNDYIDWYCELAKESFRVLKNSGNLFLMNYPKQNAYLRVKCLDDLAFDVQDYVWIYNTNVGHSKRRLTTAHRSIIHATKSKNNNITTLIPNKIQNVFFELSFEIILDRGISTKTDICIETNASIP